MKYKFEEKKRCIQYPFIHSMLEVQHRLSQVLECDCIC